MSIILRIKDLFEELSLKTSVVERELGMGNTALSKAFKDNRGIGTDTFEKIVSILPKNINTNWLLTGEGEKYLHSEEEKNPWQRLQKAEQNQDAKIFALEQYVFLYSDLFQGQPGKIKSELLQKLYSDYIDDTDTAKEYADQVLNAKPETKAVRKTAKVH